MGRSNVDLGFTTVDRTGERLLFPLIVGLEKGGIANSYIYIYIYIPPGHSKINVNNLLLLESANTNLSDSHLFTYIINFKK